MKTKKLKNKGTGLLIQGRFFPQCCKGFVR